MVVPESAEDASTPEVRQAYVSPELAPVLAGSRSGSAAGAALPPIGDSRVPSGRVSRVGAVLPPIAAAPDRLLEALAYLLEPLVDAAGSASKKDKKDKKQVHAASANP